MALLMREWLSITLLFLDQGFRRQIFNSHSLSFLSAGKSVTEQQEYSRTTCVFCKKHGSTTQAKETRDSNRLGKTCNLFPVLTLNRHQSSVSHEGPSIIHSQGVINLLEEIIPRDPVLVVSRQCFVSLIIPVSLTNADMEVKMASYFLILLILSKSSNNAGRQQKNNTVDINQLPFLDVKRLWSREIKREHHREVKIPSINFSSITGKRRDSCCCSCNS